MSSQVNVAQRISKPRTTLPYMAVDFDKSSLASSSLERGGCCNGCCRGCLGKLPYGTITASLLSICGLCLAVAALFYITSIVDRAILDLFHKKYLWFSELKVGYVIFTIIIGILIFVNLLVGFATTGQGHPKRRSKASRFCGCTRSTTTTCIIRTIFFINYLFFLVLFLITVVAFISLFSAYVMTSLCNDGSRVTVRPNPVTGAGEHNPAQPRSNYIDLQQFAPLVGLRSNETHLLRFEGPTLKKLCVDYLSSLTLCIILGTIGFGLLLWGALNFLINLSVNAARNATRQKFAEIMYLNAAEMTAFGGGGGDGLGGPMETMY